MWQILNDSADLHLRPDIVAGVPPLRCDGNNVPQLVQTWSEEDVYKCVQVRSGVGQETCS